MLTVIRKVLRGKKNMAKRASPFERIDKVKKIVFCKSCGKRIEVDNFNRMLCNRCGYRESRHTKTKRKK
jgi:hypothetical protein